MQVSNQLWSSEANNVGVTRDEVERWEALTAVKLPIALASVLSEHNGGLIGSNEIQLLELGKIELADLEFLIQSGFVYESIDEWREILIEADLPEELELRLFAVRDNQAFFFGTPPDTEDEVAIMSHPEDGHIIRLGTVLDWLQSLSADQDVADQPTAVVDSEPE